CFNSRQKSVSFFDYSPAEMILRDRELLVERRKAAEQEKLAADPGFRLPPASEWTGDTLLLLGVKFNTGSEYDLMAELKRRTQSKWTNVHKKCMTTELKIC